MTIESSQIPANQTTDDLQATDAAAVPAEASTPEAVEAKAVDAFRAGVEAATDPEAIPAPKVAADAATQAQATSPTAATAIDHAQAAATAPAAAIVAPAATDATLEAEIKGLGLKGKAADRFHEMSSAIKEIAPLREVLTKHGMTDPAQISAAIETAARAAEWENTILSSTATPDQFGDALNVIRAINSGDPKVMGQAFDKLSSELQMLGQRIGREVPGMFDPLQAHPDLMAEVNNADIPRARALEIAAQRAYTAANDQRSSVQQQEQQNQQALQGAMQQIEQLNAQLKSTDPDFARKLPMLQPTLDVIRNSMHPSQWPAAIQQAYLSLPAFPAIAPVRATPAVGHMPVRPGGSAAGMRPKPRDEVEAFRMGAYGSPEA